MRDDLNPAKSSKGHFNPRSFESMQQDWEASEKRARILARVFVSGFVVWLIYMVYEFGPFTL